MAFDFGVDIIITYDDWCILCVGALDTEKYFCISNVDEPFVMTELELVAHMYYDEYEDKTQEELFYAVENYDICGETDDCQMYMYFKYKN